MTSKELFNKKVEDKVKELKGLEPKTLDWEMVYTELYEMVYPKVVAFCNKEVLKLKNVDKFRVSELDYYSVALGDVLIRLVNDFNPSEQTGFMKLYYYRIDKAFKNLFNSATNSKNKAIMTGKELFEYHFGEYEDVVPSLTEKTIFEILDEYIEKNPKAALLKAYELQGRANVTEVIKKHLGIDKYTSTERWRVHSIKNSFYKYIKEQGYNHIAV